MNAIFPPLKNRNAPQDYIPKTLSPKLSTTKYSHLAYQIATVSQRYAQGALVGSSLTQHQNAHVIHFTPSHCADIQ